MSVINQIRMAYEGHPSQWQEYDPEEGYRKQEYDIRLKDGTEIHWTWPNNGSFIDLEDGETSYPEDDVTHVRFSHRALGGPL